MFLKGPLQFVSLVQLLLQGEVAGVLVKGPFECTVLQCVCPRLLESMVQVLEILPNPLLVLGLPPMLGRSPWVPRRKVPRTLCEAVLPEIFKTLQQLPLPTAVTCGNSSSIVVHTPWQPHLSGSSQILK